MYKKDNFACLSIPELSNSISYDDMQNKFNNFVCSKNLEIENFLHENAIEFAKKNQAISHIILDTSSEDVIAYFTLTIKPICFEIGKLSKTALKRFERMAEIDFNNNTITPAAYLIAQLGKKDSSDISLVDIFYFVDKCVLDIQNFCGGVVEFLESENNEKLIDMYKDKGFKTFNIRKSKSGEDRKLVQMYRLI